MISRAELRRRVTDILPEVTEMRHSLHRIPELHFEERETAAFIRQRLAGMRLEVLPPLMETDTVALLRGGSPGRTVLLRSDVDALPVTEKTGKPWSSTHTGKAHSCGHDGHMAMLFGAAKILEGLAGELSGAVRFVFQPAEEEACGGRTLVEKGLLDLVPRADVAFALHGWPGVPAGSLASAPGAMMAAADRFTLTVHGKGGHAALPHRAADPVVTAAQLIVSFQTIVSRSVDPQEAAVVSVCRVEGGRTSNVIPDSVVMEGTTRYFNRALGPRLRERIESITAGVCAAAGCTPELTYVEGYIPLVNDPAAVRLAQQAVGRWLGADAWSTDHPRTMGAEDFAFYLDKVPGALLRLGLGVDWQPLHSPGFDFNDQSLEAGITALAGTALDVCSL
jgi:amidohydrolase